MENPFPFKVPPIHLRALYYINDDEGYIESGREDAIKVISTYRSRNPDVTPTAILDFGGSSGRVLRHMAQHSPSSNLYLCDKHVQSIEWAKVNLPGLVSFVNEQHLPFEDNSIDLVFAMSVFTHLRNDHYWLLELRRILKPKGIAYITIHGDLIYEQLLLGEYDYLKNQIDWGKNYPQELPAEKPLVFLPDVKDPDKTLMPFVFHSYEYCMYHWNKVLTVLNITKQKHQYQDVVTMVKAN